LLLTANINGSHSIFRQSYYSPQFGDIPYLVPFDRRKKLKCDLSQIFCSSYVMCFCVFDFTSTNLVCWLFYISLFLFSLYLIYILLFVVLNCSHFKYFIFIFYTFINIYGYLYIYVYINTCIYILYFYKYIFIYTYKNIKYNTNIYIYIYIFINIYFISL
jgi:hypothetical protein